MVVGQLWIRFQSFALVPPLYDVAHGCSGCPKMFEIALDCSPLFFVLVCFWWYSVVSGLLT